MMTVYWLVSGALSVCIVSLFIALLQRLQAEQHAQAWREGYKWLEDHLKGPDADLDRAFALRIVAHAMPAKYQPELLREDAKKHEDIWHHQKATTRGGT